MERTPINVNLTIIHMEYESLLLSRFFYL
jgi:hypothetical protein